MALLNEAEFIEHFETDLATDAIQRLLDESEEQIIRKFGPHSTAITEDMVGVSKFIFPARPITSVTSITETVGVTDTVLATDDFKLIHTSRMIERLSDGTNARKLWGDRVKLIYVPDDETKLRKGVQVDLVKLAIQNEGLSSIDTGNYKATNVSDYEAEREKILSRLRRGLEFV